MNITAPSNEPMGSDQFPKEGANRPVRGDVRASHQRNAALVNGVSFLITPDGTRNNVVATIPAGEAAAGRLFGRLESSQQGLPPVL